MLNPGDIPTQAEAQGCAATEAEALGLREAALALVLMGVVQAVLAAAADVAVAGSLRGLGQWLTAPAHIVGAINACTLCYVVSRAAFVTVGHCAGAGELVADYVLVAVSYAALLGISVAVTFFC